MYTARYRLASTWAARQARDFENIGMVLRGLVKISPTVKEKKEHFSHAMRLLGEFSAANCPLAVDQLQWLLAQSWNYGVRAPVSIRGLLGLPCRPCLPLLRTRLKGMLHMPGQHSIMIFWPGSTPIMKIWRCCETSLGLKVWRS